MNPYSQDLRDRVLRALQRGERPTDIAVRFEVSREWVYDVKSRFEKQGINRSLQVGGYRKSCVAEVKEEICGWIAEKPDLTLAEISSQLAEKSIEIKPSALWHQLNNWGMSYKKNSTRQRTRTRRCASGARAMEEKSAEF